MTMLDHKLAYAQLTACISYISLAWISNLGKAFIHDSDLHREVPKRNDGRRPSLACYLRPCGDNQKLIGINVANVCRLDQVFEFERCSAFELCSLHVGRQAQPQEANFPP